jgi:predicted acylesterase/phospholipase RssA
LPPVLFGFWNHNHPIRLADEAGGKAMAALARPAPAERFAAMAQSAGGAEPVVFVTAAGGGIRAAYWTASVLAALEDELGETFSKRLFAISGVSGGSVGAAAYVTLKRAQLDAGPDASLLAPVRTVLGNDFLSPVVAGLLFPDLAQRFIPFPVTLADRQRFLERSFELAFQGDARRLFAGPFQNLYAGAAGDRLPSLLLNTTVVETGQRAVLSNLDVGGLPGVVDLFDDRYQLAAIRTSAAAGASARFTYVSPAGRVDIAGDDSVRLVDGGYFENSGAATMGDLIALLDDRIGDSDRKFRPVLIVINNDPTSVGLCRRDNGGSDTLKGGRFNAAVSEVAAPIRALFETRGARQQIAEVKAARLVEAMGGGVVQMPLAAVLDVQLETARAQAAEPLSEEAIAKIKEKYLEPPLGWSMSEEVRNGMDQTLDDRAGGLAKQFQNLTTALGGGRIPACEPM